MAPSLIYEPIAKLPIYQDGFRRGTDLGLRLALDAIVAAGYVQEQRADRTSPPTPANAHCAAVVRVVADQVAARFRQRLPL
jgi:hypothetical protein